MAAAVVAIGQLRSEIGRAIVDLNFLLRQPVSLVEDPSWSLEAWLGSLDFNAVVAATLLRRVRERTDGPPSARVEQSFLSTLGGDNGTSVARRC